MSCYKIPIIDGVFDYPAGCLLCCAYPYDGYMYCKFESVTAVESDWIKITEAEFNVRCPEFPTPAYVGEMESTDYPGCYYRMVDGEQEWINPPMVFGQTYRTTERFNGKPVYICEVEIPEIQYTGVDTIYWGTVLRNAHVIHMSGSLYELNSDGNPSRYIAIPCTDCDIKIDWDDGVAYLMHSDAFKGMRGQALFKYTMPDAGE